MNSIGNITNIKDVSKIQENIDLEFRKRIVTYTGEYEGILNINEHVLEMDILNILLMIWKKVL